MQRRRADAVPSLSGPGLLLGFALAACSSAAPVERAAPSAAAAPPGSDALTRGKNEPSFVLPPGREVSFAAELEAVESVRQLAARKPVRGLTIDRAALREHLIRSFREDSPERLLLGNRDTLIALGLAPLDFDYEQTVLDLLQDGLAGLYYPQGDVMFLLDHLSPAERNATLLHELVHALQDQHYDLDDISHYEDDASDRASARVGLAEGDATSAMFEALGRASGQPRSDEEQLAAFERPAWSESVESRVPRILRRLLLAPYADGLGFVQALRRRGGFAEVDRVWRAPPETTEQLLHLDKYDRHEPALPVELPAGPDLQPPFVVSFHDVEGEQTVRAWLEEWMPRAEAAAAARGWGGDRLAVYARGDERALAWLIESDSEKLAGSLLTALLAQTGPGAQSLSRLTGRCFLRPDRGPLAVARRGRRVAVAAGPFSLSRGGGSGAAASFGCSEAEVWLNRLLSGPSKASAAPQE